MQYIKCENGHFYDPSVYSSCPECAKKSGGFVGATEPVNAGFSGGDMGDSFKTVPINSNDWAGASGTSGGFTEPLTTSYFEGGNQSQVEDYGSTVPVTPGDTAAQPLVVGWLVCVEGPARGRDYRIHSQYNFVGRSRAMDICIEGDDSISAERAAMLAYVDQTKMFFFGPADGRNLLWLNGQVVMNAQELHAYDELTIGKSKFLFVPLCGERFDWNDR